MNPATGFAATFDELFAVTNIERPVTESQLRTILDTDETGAFSQIPRLLMDIPTSQAQANEPSISLEECLSQLAAGTFAFGQLASFSDLFARERAHA